MNASWALQQAIYAALQSDSAVTALIGARLFDAVPQSAAFPYLVIGEAEERDESTTTPATRHLLRLQVWSRGGGTRECKAIAAAIHDRLDGAALTLSGHTLIDLRFVSADYARQSDGKTFRALLRFSALTEPL